MRDCIRKKLDIIHALYPPERIATSKRRWESVWDKNKRADRRPFVYYPPLFDAYNALHTAEQRLQASLDEIIVRGQVGDDYIPSVFCGCRQSTIPNMFGAKEIIKGEDATCDKILFSAEDIDRLEEGAMAEGSVAKMWLDMQRYIIDETEGELPVHVVDMQGPFDVAGQMFGYDNLFVCAYEYPERYDRLMSLITRAFIGFWKAQRAACGDLFVGTHLFAWDYVPENTGASMSIDSLVMVSPDFYREFYQKYIENLAEEFGGLVLHSCGDFRHVVPNLMETKGLKGMNASQLSLRQLVDAGMSADIVGILTLPLEGLDELAEEMLRTGMRIDPTFIGNWSVFGAAVPPAEEWTAEQRRFLQETDERIIRRLNP